MFTPNKDGTGYPVDFKHENKEESFVCSFCKKTKPYKQNSIALGYALWKDDRGNLIKVCDDCCGKVDLDFMKRFGKIDLYLTKNLSQSNDVHEVYDVSNWPGTLKFPIYHIRKGRHNIARTRYDVWFEVDGEKWHGVQYGDWTQICHCKRIKND